MIRAARETGALVSAEDHNQFGGLGSAVAETLAKHMLGLNFAEVEEFCLSVVRRAVLDKKSDDAQSITRLKLEQWRDRLKPVLNSQGAGE